MSAPLTAPLRRAWIALTASDPGLVRLRTAGTTIAVLVAALAVLAGLAALTGQPLTAALLGVVVAMISSVAVRDPTPAGQAVTVALLVPAAAAAVTLGAIFSDRFVAGDAVFVLIAVGAVLLRRLGPRGTAIGMVAFIAYFFALFLRATPAQLPALLISLAIGALLSLGLRQLLRPRHPDRELGRMIAALQVRAGAVTAVLADGLAAGRLDQAARRRLAHRLGGCGEAALMVQQRLDDGDEAVLGEAEDRELAVRVFDVQLGTEHLAAATVALLEEEPSAAAREPAGRTLRALADALATAPGRTPAEQAAAISAIALQPVDGAGERGARFATVLGFVLDTWQRALVPSSEDDAPARRGEPPEVAGDAGAGAPPFRDTVRQAIQVGVASVVAIVVGELLSPSRWFWAVIAAFVVFTGTSTRGEILSKGWQRVLGTLAGVAAGVVVAALVGGQVLPSLALIVGCLFLGFYLMPVAYGFMIFFVTTMLALLYGLLGSFSIGLLVLRLEETAAGAAIGVAVAYLVLPASTRTAARAGARDFLGELDTLLQRVTTEVTGPGGGGAAPAESRAMRTAFDGFRNTARPLTHGLAGLPNRAGTRHAVGVLGACEHHARSLARVAGRHQGLASGDGLRPLVVAGAEAVRADVCALQGALADGAPRGTAVVRPADGVLDRVDRAAGPLLDGDRGALRALTGHLRAIDAAVCGLAADLGAGQGGSGGRRAAAGG